MGIVVWKKFPLVARLSDQAMRFVVKDIRQFSVTSGDGFMSFAQTMIVWH